MYGKGQGVRQDDVEAVKYFKLASEQGQVDAQCNLGARCHEGTGVRQDYAEACKWFQMAVSHSHGSEGHANATILLNKMQEHNRIPAPPPGTAVTTILLTSSASSKYNNRLGIVVTPTSTSTIKPGRVCVLLDGETNALAFKLKNVHLIK